MFSIEVVNDLMALNQFNLMSDGGSSDKVYFLKSAISYLLERKFGLGRVCSWEQAVCRGAAQVDEDL